jgi:hypothetical protein
MGGRREAGTEVLALAFLDLRFSDGHVERWLGPGSIGTLPAEPDGMAALQRWAADTANEFAFDIACDIGHAFETLRPLPSITFHARRSSSSGTTRRSTDVGAHPTAADRPKRECVIAVSPGGISLTPQVNQAL